MAMDSRIRLAGRADIPALAIVIRETDLYYRSPHTQTVEATIAKLEALDFGGTARFEMLLAEVRDGDAWRPAGMATLATLFPTTASSPAFFLKDLFVLEAYRSLGLGKQLMQRIAALTVERGYTRLDWTAETNNPATLRFYDTLGAQRREEKLFFRLNGEALKKLAGEE
ncbi:GNAT family N-acetyltransferase [Oceanibaculum pacificum]|uniref:N-acetyltransferase domain-containing protein n=1 Tax=Oceanibaculum pacificum TaxID=580166 RepID=A0A154WEU2_9PROT|nr:GNAT family N-acetyltransferase [Oceanibaculum pacificum]KZD12030.1 hypothetical protein AUP43_17630 [Oceanibaculum pacificum]